MIHAKFPIEEIVQYLKQVKVDLLSGKYDKELVIAVRLAKPLYKYKKAFAPARAARILRKMGRYLPHQKNQVRLSFSRAGVARRAWSAETPNHPSWLRAYLAEPYDDVVAEGLATLHFTNPTPDGNRRRAKFRQFLEEEKIKSSNKRKSPIEMSYLLCINQPNYRYWTCGKFR